MCAHDVWWLIRVRGYQFVMEFEQGDSESFGDCERFLSHLSAKVVRF